MTSFKSQDQLTEEERQQIAAFNLTENATTDTNLDPVGDVNTGEAQNKVDRIMITPIDQIPDTKPDPKPEPVEPNPYDKIQ